MKRYLRTFPILIIIQFLFYSLCMSEIYEYQYTPPESVDPSGFVHYRIYIPDSTHVLKGVYCYVPGWQGNSLYIVNNLNYQRYVEEKDFALMGLQMLGDYTNYYTGISLWSGEALINALKQLSLLSGHSELEYSALLFNGHSAGGQFSYHFTQWKPERVIAFVTIKGGYHSLSPAGKAIRIPGYMFIGENDLDYRIINLTTIFETNRSLGALWTLAMEPNGGHGRVSEEIIHSFFDQIIPMRLPETMPKDTIPQLTEINEEIGWLGDRETYLIDAYPEYTGDKSRACWFPNEKIAIEWQYFIQGIPITNINIIINHMPERIQLSQNYPNPFNSSTNIKYYLPKPGYVTLKIFNTTSQEIKTLVNGYKQAGVHEITWTAEALSSGIYFYRLQVGDPSINFLRLRSGQTGQGFLETKKLILQR